jgi:hypothetical protein
MSESACVEAGRPVNAAHVRGNWLIGQQIAKANQGSAKRTGYGEALLASLPQHLSQAYGNGLSLCARAYMPLIYLDCPEFLAKGHEVRDHSSRSASLASEDQLPTEIRWELEQIGQDVQMSAACEPKGKKL